MLPILVLTVLAVMARGEVTTEEPENTTVEIESTTPELQTLIETAFAAEKITPNIVDNPPSKLLSVKYESVEANLGNKLTPTQVKDQPTVNWTTHADKLYTLIMIDPDASLNTFLHWLVGNVPATDLEKGEVFASYLGSGPPRDTGVHRYIFLVYEQPEKIKFDETIEVKFSIQPRVKFDVRKFAEKYKLGQPIAGNFYQAEYDSYVDELYKKLKDMA